MFKFEMQKGPKEIKRPTSLRSNSVAQNIKVFSQRLTWRNGRDTAYNFKALGQRVTNKLRVIKFFQELSSHSISQNIDPNETKSFRTTMEKFRQASEAASRLPNRNIAGWRVEAYQMRLTALIVDHQNFLKTLVSPRNNPILIESEITRNSRFVTNCLLLQLMGVIRPDYQHASRHSRGVQRPADASLPLLDDSQVLRQ